MKSNDSDVLDLIIALPETFNTSGTVSIKDLLKETGYCDIYDLISEISIAEVLSTNLQAVNYWLEYSEDKRTSSGWYFKKSKNETYIVGKIDMTETSEVTFTDKFKACAAFIKREIETIRRS